MTQSTDYFARAKRLMPGGVNSPVRAFKSVGSDPIYFQHATGAYLVDVDEKHYIDYVGSWGPMILGHNHPKVREAVQEALLDGMSFGACTPLEIALAEKVCDLMPNLEQIRMVNSGTEATMTAIRLARGVTGRDKILKFEGGYHGHSDALLVNAGSGALTLGVPSSPGVPASFAEQTLVAPFNDLSAVEALFEKHGREIAAIIVEPVAGNMGCIPPVPGFLQGLRDVCDASGALLIFDEVITGFRLGLEGAQGLFQITPDITTLGKIIGGGMPVGALGGRKDVMSQLAPTGPVYQAGTLSGNPLAMAAGLATLTALQAPGFYDTVASATAQLSDGFKALAAEAKIPLVVNSMTGIFSCFFTEAPQVTCYAQAMKTNVDLFNAFFHGMLAQGIYFAPSAYECAFVSAAHAQEEINLTLSAAEKVFSTVKAQLTS